MYESEVGRPPGRHGEQAGVRLELTRALVARPPHDLEGRTYGDQIVGASLTQTRQGRGTDGDCGELARKGDARPACHS